MAAIEAFEDHCWKGFIPAESNENCQHYRHETFRDHRSACGKDARDAFQPTKGSLAAARAAGLPVIWSGTEAR